MTRVHNSGVRSVCMCKQNAASALQPSSNQSSGERRLARGTRGAAAWALPSILLALVPKCPMCIAAYLAIGGSLGVSFTMAAHLRTALVWLCWSALLLLAIRMTIRFMRGSTMTVLKLT